MDPIGPCPRTCGGCSSISEWGPPWTAERELSESVGQHRWFDTAHHVRETLGLDAVASVHIGDSGGKPVSTSLRFKERRLELNRSTEAASSVRLEVQHETGDAIPEFALEQAPDLYGDGIEEPSDGDAEATSRFWKGSACGLGLL